MQPVRLTGATGPVWCSQNLRSRDRVGTFLTPGHLGEIPALVPNLLVITDTHFLTCPSTRFWFSLNQKPS